jgi:hypothetical protein
VVFSPWRDDGGRKSPELPAQLSRLIFAAAIVIVVI